MYVIRGKLLNCTIWDILHLFIHKKCKKYYNYKLYVFVFAVSQIRIVRIRSKLSSLNVKLRFSKQIPLNRIFLECLKLSFV